MNLTLFLFLRDLMLPIWVYNSGLIGLSAGEIAHWAEDERRVNETEAVVEKIKRPRSP